METYNSIADLYKGIAKKTENLIDKLNSGQKITRRETKELEELKKQAADKMNKSADYFLKSLGTEGSQPILDQIKAANESCVCNLETEEVKKGPFYDDIFVNLDDCKKCLEEQKKKQEQAALLAKAFEKRYKSMKNQEMTCGCLSWGNFLQDISIIDGLTDCEEIVSIMNKAKADLSNIGSADFSVNNLFFDENKPTGQVSIGNTCIDNFSLKANPNSASIVVNRDKKTQYNDQAVEISSNNITITDYSNPGSNLVIGTDDNDQARLVEKWMFEGKKEIPINDDESKSLGNLSKKYESGNRGPGTVSTGKGDHGGVSYGSYQFATNNGSILRFINSPVMAEWSDQFKGLTPATPEFNNVWKKIARKNPNEFYSAQHKYIYENYYLEMKHNIKEVINLDEYSLSLKDVVWSVAVQHGSSSGLIKKALINIDLKKASEKEIIEAIYAERGRKNAKGILVYFSSSSLNVQKNISKRYENEENEAISKL